MPTLSEPPNRSQIVGAMKQPAQSWQRWFTLVRAALTGPYFYIPTISGAPSGTPEVRAGFVPMVYDTANDDLYVYNTAWVKVTLS